MLEPVKATIEQRYKDMPLDVVLLTDGEIWNQQTLFSYLNESITESKAPIRIFTLGIGNGVSHALREGVAKAGNGFSQTVGDGEKMDTKVVRMLKGALSPHVNDYTQEVKYANATLDEEDEDFEVIERVIDSLNVRLDLNDEVERPETVSGHCKAYNLSPDHQQKSPISLFDTSADIDKQTLQRTTTRAKRDMRTCQRSRSPRSSKPHKTFLHSSPSTERQPTSFLDPKHRRPLQSQSSSVGPVTMDR